MKKLLMMVCCVVTFIALSTVSASAVVNDTVKVGLRYGSTAMFSANLENAVGSGYSFGFFDDDRYFEEIGWTDEIAISMTAADVIYMSQNGTYSDEIPSGGYREMGAWRVQVDGFRHFEDALDFAEEYDGWPAWVDFEYVVRFGCFDTEREAEQFADELEGYVVETTSTGVVVTATRTTNVLFEFDTSGVVDFGVLPQTWTKEPAVTWFKGYRYYGGFEYPRTTGGYLSVINVVDLEDYVKGVIPYEMNGEWPLAALEAQAVCARTYVCGHSKHLSAHGFDVCNTTDCQVYYGVNKATALSDRAVENTTGECIYHERELIQNAVYHSSNGGATEDCANVWGGERAYLRGKEDPYEAEIAIPNYAWSVTYTAAELTWILEEKGYTIGTVKDVYVSEFTPMGNVAAITFEGSRGDKTVTGETCRTIFYSSTYEKSAKSMRFSINGDGPVTNNTVYAGDGERLTTLNGVSVISAGGKLGKLEGESFTVLSASGTSVVQAGAGEKKKPTNAAKKGEFTLSGTGSGHNLGMSQYGAKAMAELGYDYREILEFYYTDITVK